MTVILSRNIHLFRQQRTPLIITHETKSQGGNTTLLEATSRVYRRSADAANVFAIATFWRLYPI